MIPLNSFPWVGWQLQIRDVLRNTIRLYFSKAYAIEKFVSRGGLLDSIITVEREPTWKYPLRRGKS